MQSEEQSPAGEDQCWQSCCEPTCCSLQRLLLSIISATAPNPKRQIMPRQVIYTRSPASFISASSYSPAPSLPLPLPLPRDSPTPSSSVATGCLGAGLLPKLMGFSSRHWQAHTPTDVITVALHIWSIHQRRFAGMACEYNEVTTRWIKCTVRAKSSTSLERAIKRRMNMTLQKLAGWMQHRDPMLTK
jgi:hypothetical protein